MRPRILIRLDPLIYQSFSRSQIILLIPPIIIASLWSFSLFSTSSTTQYFQKALSSALIPNWAESKAFNLKGILPTVISVLAMILSLNIVRLLPYTLAFTRHLYLAVAFAIPLWARILISGWVKNPIVAAASLVPQGAPIALGPFVAILETLRVLVRPLSLRLRLIVNIRAGHLLLSFMRQLILAILFSNTIAAPLILFIEIGYLILEVGISLIQAYIFTTLLSLYANEHP